MTDVQLQIDWRQAYGSNAAVAFDAWVDANPKAYEAIAIKAIELRRYHGKVGSKWLGEWARWELPMIRTDLNFKFNNDFTPYLSRRLLKDYPELSGAFELRKASCDYL